MDRLKEAQKLELLGFKERALDSYKDILIENSHNLEARRGINRVLGLREEFKNPNQEMIERFISIDSENELLEFERWLAKLWI